MGNNNGTPGAPNGVKYSAVEFHGLQVHLGVKVEFEALLAKMQSNDGLAKIKETCTSGLTLAGHSLGGGTSQLMATLLNKKGDPLGAGLTVDHLFWFGPMPFVKDTAATNDKRKNGCFAGGVYANAPSRTEDGTPEVDLVWQMLTDTSLSYRHVKTSHHLLFGPGEEEVTPCGEEVPYPYTGKTVKKTPMMAAHAQSLYVNNVGFLRRRRRRRRGRRRRRRRRGRRGRRRRRGRGRRRRWWRRGRLGRGRQRRRRRRWRQG